MAKWYKSILSNAGRGLVEGIGQTIDRFIHTEENKQKAKRQLVNLVKMYEGQKEAELSARHKQDMNSDSWLSKNIRPLTLIFLVVALSALATGDGNIGSFEIQKEYIEMLESLTTLAFSFYFGGRTGEKIFSLIQKRNKSEN